MLLSTCVFIFLCIQGKSIVGRLLSISILHRIILTIKFFKYKSILSFNTLRIFYE